MVRPIAFGVFLLLVSGTAKAEDQLELGAYGGYLFGGSAEAESDTLTSKATIEGSPSFGATIDKSVRRGAFAEFSYTRQATELSLRQSDGASYRYDLVSQYFQLGGLLEFRTSSLDWFRPTFGGTLGATVFTANDTLASYEEWRFSFAFEGGAKIRLASFLGLRFRARGFATFLTDDSALFCVTGAGCAFAYSGTALLQGEVAAGAYLAF
jgi:hypothetical protein